MASFQVKTKSQWNMLIIPCANRWYTMAGGYALSFANISKYINNWKQHASNVFQQIKACSKNNALHDFPFYFFSQFLQSQRSCSLNSIAYALYILKMPLIPSTLCQRSLKLHAAEAVSHCKWCCCCCCSPNMISGITKGLSPLKPANVSHLRPLTAHLVFFFTMKTSLP